MSITGFSILNLGNRVILIGVFDIFISIAVIFNNMLLLMEKFTDAIDSRNNIYFYISSQSEVVDIIGIIIYTMIMLSAGVLIVGVIKGKPKHLEPWMTFKLLLVVFGVLSQIVYLCVLSVSKSEAGEKSRVFSYILVMELAVVVQLALAVYMLLTVSTFYTLLRNTKAVPSSEI